MIRFGQRRMTNARGHAKWGRTGPPHFSLLDSAGSAATGVRDMEILSGQILLGVRVGQQCYKRQQQSNRFFHDVLSPRFQPECLFPQGLVEEGRSGSGLAHDQLSFCPVFRTPA